MSVPTHRRRLLPWPGNRCRAAVGFGCLLLLAGCGGKAPELSVTTDSRPAAPRAVSFDPPNGAIDVDPARVTLTVGFDRVMDREGWAWVIENPATAPQIGESQFDPEGRSNTAQVRLEPGRDYVVWVNSPEYSYFRDLNGVPATPARWTFSTAGASGLAGDRALVGRSPSVPPLPGGPPRIVKLEPANGATGVDASVTELRATFDRVMAEGWSWVIEDADLFPQTTGEAFQSADRRVAVLPVRLEPGRSYVVWLNSQQYRFFRDPAGAELQPVRWSFSTAP